MLIYKFKGAVMQNPEMIAGIRNEIQKQSENCIVVVSALKGVMPRLRALYALSLKKGSGFEEEFKEFRHVHADLAEHLLAGNKLPNTWKTCKSIWMSYMKYCIRWLP